VADQLWLMTRIREEEFTNTRQQHQIVNMTSRDLELVDRR